MPAGHGSSTRHAPRLPVTRAGLSCAPPEVGHGDRADQARHAGTDRGAGRPVLRGPAADRRSARRLPFAERNQPCRLWRQCYSPYEPRGGREQNVGNQCATPLDAGKAIPAVATISRRSTGRTSLNRGARGDIRPVAMPSLRPPRQVPHHRDCRAPAVRVFNGLWTLCGTPAVDRAAACMDGHRIADGCYSWSDDAATMRGCCVPDALWLVGTFQRAPEKDREQDHDGTGSWRCWRRWLP